MLGQFSDSRRIEALYEILDLVLGYVGKPQRLLLLML